MINVVDRVPTYPNRVKITHSNGSSEYVTWERADEPTVPGTPINKALFDSIVEDIGLNKATTVYVSTAGSDTLGDGTAANPYATIQKAINSLPKNLNGFDATINVAAGTYNEDVLISRFSGGNIVFRGVTNASVSVRSLRITYGAKVMVFDIKLIVTGDYDGNAISAINAEFYCFVQASIVGAPQIGVLVDTFARCIFVVLDVSNSSQAAVSAINRSSFFALALQGTGNTSVGIRSVAGSVISYGTSTLSASTGMATASGGRIYSGAQASIPNY